MPDANANAPDEAGETFSDMLRVQASKALSANTARDFILAKLSTDTLSQLESVKNAVQKSLSSSSPELQSLQQEYNTKIEKVGKQFSVQSKPSEDEPSLITDLVVDPPDGNTELSPEQRALFIKIYTVKTVIKKACANLSDRGSIANIFKIGSYRADRDSRRTTDRYLRKLQEIADYGLVRGQIDLAKQQLEGLMNEFVVSEAAEIKNAHIRRLGLAAGVSGVLFAATYGMILLPWIESIWPKKNIDLFSLFVRAGLGACIGTWLSFAIRKETLRFDELANLEADLLRPVYRLAFVILLTMTLCLMFTASALQVEIGSLRTNVFAGNSNVDWPGLVALLIGVLCGVSERRLAGSVEKRATDFTGNVGGST